MTYVMDLKHQYFKVRIPNNENYGNFFILDRLTILHVMKYDQLCGDIGDQHACFFP